MPLGLAGFDRRRLGEARSLVGIDEAGRGALAGPVVAAAVRCESRFYASSWCRRHSAMVDDSKRLRSAQRSRVVERYTYACSQKWISIGIGAASIEEIERHNIYHANGLAMRRALEQVMPDGGDSLFGPPDPGDGSVCLLIDGKPIRTFPVRHEGVVGGDRRSLAIALAGIHAKEHRDALMRDLDRCFPEYGFARHKGYGTSDHLEAIRLHGACPHHRPSFLRKLREEGPGPTLVMQDSLFQGNCTQISGE